MTPGGPKHTPGPWTNDGSRAVRATVGGQEITIGGAKLYIVPLAPAVTTHDQGQAVANARLMAAAPDLLEACEDLACLAGFALKQNSIDDGFDPEDMISIRRARAAIAKATGAPKGGDQ